MIKLKLNEGTLMLGIEERNVEHLKSGNPMLISGVDVNGFGDVKQIAIVYGETLREVYDIIAGVLKEKGVELPPFVEPKKRDPS